MYLLTSVYLHDNLNVVNMKRLLKTTFFLHHKIALNTDLAQSYREKEKFEVILWLV